MVIRPISDLRNTNEISEQSHKINEPIFITKNGYGDMVIMSMEFYEKCMKARSNADEEVKNRAAVQAAGMGAANAIFAPESDIAAETGRQEKQVFSPVAESFEGIRHIREKYGKK